MNILIDSAMIDGHRLFSPFGSVKSKEGRMINADDLKDIDALFIRSVTKVDAALLEKASQLKFIGTATAGFDHVDTDELKKRNIAFVSAPGSNKESVGDYILSVLLTFARRYCLDLSSKRIGIVGCGNTGSQVIKKARALGLNLCLCDTPRADNGQSEYSASLDEILSCDIVTLHVPLIKDGPYKTAHLIDAAALSKLKDGAFLINASRGGVVDNRALLQCFKEGRDVHVWLDVFEGEPEIDVKELLPYLDGASAHIAGYSYESKRRATFMLQQSFLKFLGMECNGVFEPNKGEIVKMVIDKDAIFDLNLISRLVFAIYDVSYDSFLFKHSFNGKKSFDLMRKNYRERHELGFVTIAGEGALAHKELLEGLGFKVSEH